VADFAPATTQLKGSYWGDRRKERNAFPNHFVSLAENMVRAAGTNHLFLHVFICLSLNLSPYKI